MRNPEVSRTFDSRRPEFASYGFSCETWRPQSMNRPDRHNEIELNYLTRGSLTYLMWGRRCVVTAGRLVAFWAAIPHQVLEHDQCDPYHVMTVPLPWVLSWSLPACLVDALLAGELVEDRPTDGRVSDAGLLAQWKLDLAASPDGEPEATVLEVRARMVRLADRMRRARQTTRARAVSPRGAAATGHVERMAAYLARNYTRRVRIADVATHVGLNPDYAAALFRRTFGMTINHFLVDHRISHAQRQLVATDDKILAIAMDAGFNAVSRFNEAFRDACGCTPREYRRQHRRGAIRGSGPVPSGVADP